jgi:hypothetical protein
LRGGFSESRETQKALNDRIARQNGRSARAPRPPAGEKSRAIAAAERTGGGKWQEAGSWRDIVGRASRGHQLSALWVFLRRQISGESRRS